MKVLLAAGGTGGHIAPALAVAMALEEARICKREEILFVGSGKEIENRLIEGAGYKLKQIASKPFLGGGKKGVLEFLKAFPETMRHTREIVLEHGPRVVLTFGGYPSMGPALVAAARGIPLIVQEQNAQVGLANKFLSLFARQIFTVPGARGFLRSSRVVHQPNPVRKELSGISLWRPPAPGQPMRLLVMGGSQGAVSMNTGVLALLPELQKLGISVFHQSGEVDLERVKKAYHDLSYEDATVVPFTNKIVEEYEKAHLIIARAGAMSVWEISTAGRPAIFVPLKIARAHQSLNAKHLVEMGAARIVEHGDDYESKLKETVLGLLGNVHQLGAMSVKMREASRVGKENAAQIIAKCVFDLGKF